MQRSNGAGVRQERYERLVGNQALRLRIGTHLLNVPRVMLLAGLLISIEGRSSALSLIHCNKPKKAITWLTRSHKL